MIELVNNDDCRTENKMFDDRSKINLRVLN